MFVWLRPPIEDTHEHLGRLDVHDHLDRPALG